MDFKVAGTRDGVTAVQVDIKLKTGITLEIIQEALLGAKKARYVILDKMEQAISKPREELSIHAPRIVNIKISTEKIKDVIGPGGKVIKKIIADTGVSIDIDDDGTVSIASTDPEAMDKAVNIVNKITEDPEVGKTYMATVKKVMNFGAFCEILPGKEGLVHVSELSDKFVKNVEDVVKVGDEFLVKLVAIDDQGRLNLSRKKAMASGELKDE
jgi:polyribonucleotide nucleotidyltransferase